jgi:hypothetical protein
MASMFAFRETRSLSEVMCFEKREDRRSSDAGEWTQAMYLEKFALESLGALSRLFRIGVPRFPVDVIHVYYCRMKKLCLPQPRMHSV